MMTQMKSRAALTGVLTLALLTTLAGCSDPSTPGKVIATVNGQDITDAELSAEMDEAGVPADQRSKAQDVILERIVERKLLTAVAKKANMDKDAGYIAARERASELLLAQFYLKQSADALKADPSADEIAQYRQAHPQLDSAREELAVEQIRFPKPADAAAMAAIEKIATVPALLNHLQQAAIPLQRSGARIDTATAPAELADALLALKPGEPLIVTGGPAVTAYAVVARRPIAMTPEQSAAVIKTRIIGDRIAQSMRKEQEQLRSSAKITYSEGFAAPARGGR